MGLVCPKLITIRRKTSARSAFPPRHRPEARRKRRTGTGSPALAVAGTCPRSVATIRPNSHAENRSRPDTCPPQYRCGSSRRHGRGNLTAHCGRRTSSTGLAGSDPNIPAAEYGSKDGHSRRHEIPSRRSVKPFRHTGRFVSGLPSFRETTSVAGPLDENGAPHAASSECGENRIVAFFSPDSQVGLMEVIMKRTGHRDDKTMKPYRETESRPNGYTRQVSGTAKAEKQAEPQGRPNRPQPIGGVRFYMLQPSKKMPTHRKVSSLWPYIVRMFLRPPHSVARPHFPKTKFPPATTIRGRGKFFKTYGPVPPDG